MNDLISIWAATSQTSFEEFVATVAELAGMKAHVNLTHSFELKKNGLRNSSDARNTELNFETIRFLFHNHSGRDGEPDRLRARPI
jgi:hypothetical protein